MRLNYTKYILELIEKRGAVHKDEIFDYLIKRHCIAKKKQKKFKTNIYVNYLTKLIDEQKITRSGKNIYQITLHSKSPVFVEQYTEKVSVDKLDALKILSKKFRNLGGFYFLYKGKNLYYIGIGENVIKRLRDHTNTKLKHGGKWNNFSFYITERIEHAKQIETLVQRNLTLDGNTNIGKLKNATDVTKQVDSLHNILNN